MPNPILSDGLDMYNGLGAGTGMQGGWTCEYTTVNNSMITGRFGGQGYRANYGLASFTWRDNWSKTFIDGLAYSTLCVAFGFRTSLANMSGRTQPILTLRTGFTTQVAIYIDVAGVVYAVRGNMNRFGDTGVVLASSAAGRIAANTWHYIRFGAVISDTVGTVQVWVDGNNAIPLTTGLDTKDHATIGTANNICIPTSSDGVVFDYDDFYAHDSASDCGELRVETLNVLADTAQKDFAPSTGTGNAVLLDEAQVNSSDYVSASSAGAKDLYTLNPLSSTPSSIVCVNVVSFSLKTDATAKSVYHTIQSNAVNSDGSALSLAATVVRKDRMVVNDPDGSVAWAAAKVNALLIGPKAA